MKLWYMRDNHTFRPLPLNLEEAIAILKNEVVDSGDSYGSYGMLCARDSSMNEEVVHAHGRAAWPAFEAAARKWLAKALASAPAPVKHTYQFPTHLRKMWSGTEVQRWIDENIPAPVTRAAIDLLDSYPLKHPKQFDASVPVLLAAAAKGGDQGTIELAAQLLGAAPCPVCGFVQTSCRCEQPTTPETPCKWCVGTGKFADHACRFCAGKGTGSVMAPDDPTLAVEPWYGHHFKQYPGGIWRCADKDCGYEIRVASEGYPQTKEDPPLQMIIEQPCPSCSGVGGFHHDKRTWVICGNCSGNGKVRQFLPRPPEASNAKA